MPGMMGKVNEENAAPEGRARSSTETSHQEATHPIEAPSLSLPKGGGAIRGIGEKFAANPVTGTGTLTVPIATSPGRAEFGPEFSHPCHPRIKGPFVHSKCWARQSDGDTLLTFHLQGPSPSRCDKSASSHIADSDHPCCIFTDFFAKPATIRATRPPLCSGSIPIRCRKTNHV
jgi:hypothetical protein